MAERYIGDLLKEYHTEKKSGALYVDMVQASEDMLKIYLEGGKIYFVRYGSAVGKECLDILEYYNLYSATFFEGITAPQSAGAGDLPPTESILAKFEELKKKVKVR